MKSKRRLLLAMYWAPIIITIIRVILTFVVFIWNPFGLPMRFIQIIPVIVLCVTLFMYIKLYRDNDPIVTLLLPTIAHFLVIFGFKRVIVLVPFIPLLLVDIAFLVIKGLKSTSFPFEIEGEEEYEDELEDVEDE